MIGGKKNVQSRLSETAAISFGAHDRQIIFDCLASALFASNTQRIMALSIESPRQASHSPPDPDLGSIGRDSLIFAAPAKQCRPAIGMIGANSKFIYFRF